MKVTVIAPSMEQAESWGGWLAMGFQQNGHEVRLYGYRDAAAIWGPETMTRQLNTKVNSWNSDILIIVKGELVPPALVAKWRRKGFLVGLLANDDHQVLQQVSLPLGRECDHVFTFTKGTLPNYANAGIKASHIYFYAETSSFTPKDLPQTYDVSFVGTYYPERYPLVYELARSGLKFRLIGDGWDDAHLAGVKDPLPKNADWSYGGRPDYTEVVRTWHSSKVCLNIHQDGLKVLGVVANLRCFELGALGRFMGTDAVQGMEQAFGSPRPF